MELVKNNIPNKILINNLRSKIDFMRPQIESAINRVLNRGHFVLGPEVETFEKSFSEYLKINHCISVGNGTDALELALRSLEIKPGDKVATVANAGAYALTAILALGAEPVFMDVGLDTRVLEISEVERVMTRNIKAIIVTHLYGQVVPQINEIVKLCRQKHVKVIEDCAQAHGAKLNGQYVSTFGDAGCFSFYPTKNLGALGDGGAVVTNSPDIARSLKLLRQYGWGKKYAIEKHGARNSRLDEMQAAILNEFLPYLEKWNQSRRTIASRYLKEIKNPAINHPLQNGETYVAHLYVITCRHRDLLRSHLLQCGIISDIHYPISDHQQFFIRSNYSNISLPNTLQLCQEILTIPCFPEMTSLEINHVIGAVNSFSI